MGGQREIYVALKVFMGYSHEEIQKMSYSERLEAVTAYTEVMDGIQKKARKHAKRAHKKNVEYIDMNDEAALRNFASKG